MSAAIIKDLYHACNPWKDAGEEYYVDCAEARGNSVLKRSFMERLSKVSGTEEFVRFLFSGHQGCGKSSEIQALLRAIAKPEPGLPVLPPYLIVAFDALEYFNQFASVTAQEVLLAMVSELAEVLRGDKYKIELADNQLTKRLSGIWQELNARVPVESTEISLGLLKAKLKPLAIDERARGVVQEALSSEPDRLLNEINATIDQALKKLRKHHICEGIVFVVDNLEKLRPSHSASQSEESLRSLYIGGVELLAGVNAHVLYTVPLSLMRSCPGELQAAYSHAPLVLPMVTIRSPQRGAPYLPGINALKRLLAKRCAGIPLTGSDTAIFTDEALELLLEMSGGYTRNLMIFVQETCTVTDSLPFTVENVRQGIIPTMRFLSPAIPAAYWPKLAQIERNDYHQIDTADEDHRAMLEQVYVMEYVNGGGGEDEWMAPGMPWYGVNPVLSKLPQFRAVLRSLQTVLIS